MEVVRLLLYPFSLIYSFVLFCRNALYDKGIIKSYTPTVPTIVIGNLSFGGTGKTPFTEFLVKKLTDEGLKVAVLSRGYGRITKGYLEVNTNSLSSDTGDEPLQIKRKFPSVPVVVCEQRTVGAKKLEEQYDLDCIILDDAFQHRKVQGHLNILLTTYRKPFFKDLVTPAGTLRDWMGSAARADIVVVTKCPADISGEEVSQFSKRIGKKTAAPIFFANFTGDHVIETGSNEKSKVPLRSVLFSGIANPQHFEDQVSNYSEVLNHIKFKDHHPFNEVNIMEILDNIGSFAKEDVALITTEKDYMRLPPWLDRFADVPLFYWPIQLQFLFDEDQFNEKILRIIRGADPSTPQQ